MRYKVLPAEQKWIIKGIPVLFIVGSLMHFLYDFSGKNVVAGLFSPVNESIWEHLKLVLWPVLCWWCIYYLVNGTKNKINKDKWFTASLVALIVPMIVIPSLYYLYTSVFGIESVVVDIIIYFIGILVGQILGLHVYKNFNGIDAWMIIFILIVIVLIFVLFTFNPPHLEIFKESKSGKYGI